VDTGLPMFFEGGIPRVTWTKPEDIAVTVELGEGNIEAMKNALCCYETYQEMVKTTNVIERIGNRTHFELVNERPDHVLAALTEGLEDCPENCCTAPDNHCSGGGRRGCC
jgi:hypothetical protein